MDKVDPHIYSDICLVNRSYWDECISFLKLFSCLQINECTFGLIDRLNVFIYPISIWWVGFDIRSAFK